MSWSDICQELEKQSVSLIVSMSMTLVAVALWCRKPACTGNLDDWLTMHHSITLVDFHLDAQNLYLCIYNTFIKILYIFRALPCSSSGGLRRNCVYAASGIVPLCR
jgi:hypothetical protein